MKNKNCKYIFVTGGVLSGVGKGITAASMGAILKARGYKVSIQKCDPYLNVDAGLLHPLEHGECFVTKDGVETDLDLGHYERFLDIETNRYSTTLSGAIFKELIDKERSGGFGGKTIQMLPHFTGLVQEKISLASRESEIHIVEIGGTVGDYESLAFIEAIRLFANKVGRENCLYVSVVYVPWINTSKEFKSKPAQNALRDLRGFGIIPDVVCVRTERLAPQGIMNKIAEFSGVAKEAVVNLPDIKSVYDVPQNILKSGVLLILNRFVGAEGEVDLSEWKEFSERCSKKFKKTVRVGLATPYLGNEDVGLSVMEAVKAAAAWREVNVEFVWVGTGLDEKAKAGAEAIRDGAKAGMGAEKMKGLGMNFDELELDAVVELEGFMKFGKGLIAEWALEKGIPYLGLGRDEGKKWLGEKKISLVAGSLVASLYGEVKIAERERFWYEPKAKEVARMEKLGCMVVGKSEGVGVVVERGGDGGASVGGAGVGVDGCVVGVEDDGAGIGGKSSGKGFFVMIQGRPEYKSRPLKVHPLFGGLVEAAQMRWGLLDINS